MFKIYSDGVWSFKDLCNIVMKTNLIKFNRLYLQNKIRYLKNSKWVLKGKSSTFECPPKRVLGEKINLQSNITSNMAKKRVFPTFRLEYFKILT